MITRNYERAIDQLKDASVRIRRLYALASYEVVKSFAKGTEHYVKYARTDILPLDGSRATLGQTVGHEIRRAKLQKDAEDALAAVRQRPQEDHLYRIEIAHELVVLCLTDSVPWERLVTCIWGTRCWEGMKTWDAALCEDLDLMGPGETRRTPTAWAFKPTTVGLARACYEGDWEQVPVLADALEELEDAPGAWGAHLRTHERHWQGCWVIDNVMGRR